ncbi:hypothetical protein CBL_04289 [Carabus blaptoides fortunei]
MKLSSIEAAAWIVSSTDKQTASAFIMMNTENRLSGSVSEITQSLRSAKFDKEITKAYDTIKTMGTVSELDVPYNNRPGCDRRTRMKFHTAEPIDHPKPTNSSPIMCCVLGPKELYLPGLVIYEHRFDISSGCNSYCTWA